MSGSENVFFKHNKALYYTSTIQLAALSRIKQFVIFRSLSNSPRTVPEPVDGGLHNLTLVAEAVPAPSTGR